MGLPAPRITLILTAALFALSCFGFTLFVWRSFGGPTPLGAQGYQFHIPFGSEASQLQPNADVRISGVNVGKVVRVERQGLGADATVELESEFAPLPSDARAIIRFKSLLGESFVELSPGSRTAAKIPEDGRLARSQVAPVQQVDVVLGAFDEPTRRAFKRFLTTTAKALDGRGADLNAALGHLAPATEGFADVTEILDRQRGALRSLIADSGVVLRTIGSRQAELQRLVRASNQVFSATAARNRELTATVRALPRFLRTTRAALRDIDETADVAKPLLRDLRPVIPLIRPALDETALLAPGLQRAFGDLGPVIDAAGRGLPALTRVLRAAKPAFDVLDVAGRYLVPTADFLRLYRRDVITWLAKLAATANFDAPSGQRMARLITPFDEETFIVNGRREASNRHNAYTLPGEIGRLSSTGVRAWHCRNVGNPQTIPVIGSGAPPCQVAPPIHFRGLTGQFPRVRPQADTAVK